MKISKLSIEDSVFPDSMRALDDAPKSINVLGELPKGVYVAIVGTRKPTSYGRQITYELARELSRAGAVIVSGLAYGCDSIAHQAVVDVGGKTVAVVAHGLDRIYPASHRELAKQILATGGAIVSEYEVGTPPLQFRFIERNRIIAGISQAVIVTEASVRSGALFTATRANRLGLSLMAVPGQVTNPNAAGPNNLIYQGATLIRSAADAIVELGFLTHEAQPVPAASAEEANILELLTGSKMVNSDTLIETTGLAPEKFANIISLMEISGKVRNLGAGLWAAR